MKKIICKICGTEVDADLGICPNCGALFYVLDDKDESITGEDTGNKSADNSGFESQVNLSDQINSADNDELFNTRRWKTSDINAVTESAKQQPPQRPVRQQQSNNMYRQQNNNNVNRQNLNRPKYQYESGEEPNQSGKDPKRPFILAGIGLVAVLIVVLTIMSGAFNFHKNDDATMMPSVVGLKIETAESLLKESLELEVTVIHEKDEAPKDEVIKQTIKEGDKVDKGDKVTLTVSSGPKEEEKEQEEELVAVPQLVGLDADNAKGLVERYGLIVTFAEEAYSPKPKGEVIKQNPLSGAKVKENDIVTLTVSKGEEPPPEHRIDVTSGKGGSISPNGSVDVEDGEDATFTITPDEGYVIREVKVDGKNIGATTQYNFTNVTGNHTIYAVFDKKQEPTPTPEEPTVPEEVPEKQPEDNDSKNVEDIIKNLFQD